MDLKNGKIKVKEVLAVPKAKEVFEREFGEFSNRPMMQMAAEMSLAKVAKIAQKHVDREKIERIINELEQI